MKPHEPVLLDAVIELLSPKPGESYLDATAGYGGHAARIMDLVGHEATVVLVDQDQQAIDWLKRRFGSRARVIQRNYADAAQEFAEQGMQFNLILMDLGVSSPQLDSLDRGFSFHSTAALDMRMDRTQSLSAAEVVNDYSEEQLAEVIHRYGEERYARRIARAIVVNRPVATTTQLAQIIRRVIPPSGRIDRATRSFQAIRIEVNQELANLERAMPLLLDLLAPGGRWGIISFHSLEDRLAKTFFRLHSTDCICPPPQPVCTCSHSASLRLINTRPIKGQLNHTNNPRARSAKLRVVEKIKQNQKEGK